MALSNIERIGKGLELLKAGLKPFIEREMKSVYGTQWAFEAREAISRDMGWRANAKDINFDAQALLSLMWNRWNEAFKTVLGYAERSLISELRETRNNWAHQKPFSTDDTYRAFDSMQLLLAAVSAPEAQEIDRLKQEVLRNRFEEQAKREIKKATVAATEGQPAAGQS